MSKAISSMTTAQNTRGCCCVYCLACRSAFTAGMTRADPLSSNRMLRGLIFLAMFRYCCACGCTQLAEFAKQEKPGAAFCNAVYATTWI